MTSKLSLQSLLALLMLGVVMCAISACGTNPQIGGIDQYRATTPPQFSENRVFHLGDAEGDLRPLLPVFQSAQNATPEERTDPRGRFVQHNQPLSVVVNSVRLPREGVSARPDVAVVLDILTTSEQAYEPLIIRYQTNSDPGTSLNFRHLLVHHTPAWDADFPPYFRIRVMDVKKEDNEAVRHFLAQLSSFADSFGAAVPHPVLPAVQFSMQVASVVLGNQKNVAILDFEVQFYSTEWLAQSSFADIAYLQKGHWIVIGKPTALSDAVWTRPMFFDRVHEVVVDDQGNELPFPYVLMTVSTSEAVVPKLVFDRSQALLQHLSTDPSQQDIDTLRTQASTLASAIRTYTSSRLLRRFPNRDRMNEVIDLLKGHEAATAATPEKRLSTEDLHLLMLTVERSTRTPFADLEDLLTWWDGGGQNGRFTIDPNTGERVWTVIAARAP